MKKYSLVLLVLLGLNACKKSERPMHGSLKLLTYNVAGLPQGLSSSNPLYFTSPISPLLNLYEIVHVQEDFCYHDSLTQSITHQYQTTTTGCVPGGDGLNTFSRFPISSVYREKWNDCTAADCLTPKGFSYSQIDIGNGNFIDFYNVHTNAGSSTEAITARRNNMIQLTNYIRAHSEGKPVVVMGDFNSRYTRAGDSLQLMTQLGFEDSWIKLIRHGDYPTVGSSLTNCTPNHNSIDCEKVDKVFYKSGDKMSLSAFYYQLDDSRFYYHGNSNQPLSDHWPLYVLLDYELK